MSTKFASEDYGLSLVSAPQAGNLKLDVIFVHGLRGHRTRTWTNAENVLWLTWLEEDIPSTRIWTYGYNANVWFDPSLDHITQHTKRLLNTLVENKIGMSCGVVLVGHSLGGILIKSVSRNKGLKPLFP
jgi:predicted alpha/beta hydrolase family esterase